MFLAIKDYWKFQHYHTRGAPWIKLYAATLADAAFVQLPEAAQAQLMKLWLLASQMGHPLPNNPKLLAGKIGALGRFYLRELVAAGFITPCDTLEDASAIAGSPPARGRSTSGGLAEREQNASTGASNAANNLLAEREQDASATRARTRGRERAESGEEREERRDSTAPLEGKIKQRSGDLDQERAAAPLTDPPAGAGNSGNGTAASAIVGRWLDAFYWRASTSRKYDVARQLEASLSDRGVRLRAGVTVHAYTLARLEAACQSMLNSGDTRDSDRAIVVLLTRLGDTSDGSAPGVAEAVAFAKATEDAFANADPRAAELLAGVANARSVR